DSSQASVLEQGNTIYVYPIGAPSTGGDLIEMFSKFPGETLQQSITRQLLTGTSSSACTINVSSSNTYQGGYFEAQIVASSSGQTEPICDSEYLAQGDSQFFLYDINYPDEFFFFNVSSSTILAAGEEPWQDTVEILK
ncbi:MAG: hypothetical protein KGJ34_01775, partial [Patescibacteria group bacterium]|nr:hypothetical protein [Patescibacteria group bacterium]